MTMALTQATLDKAVAFSLSAIGSWIVSLVVFDRWLGARRRRRDVRRGL